MAEGPGKYDDEATAAREATGALAVALIVLGGTRGSGFSVQAVELANTSVLKSLPDLLRSLADQIERDVSKPR